MVSTTDRETLQGGFPTSKSALKASSLARSLMVISSSLRLSVRTDCSPVRSQVRINGGAVGKVAGEPE
jgi:hypothetical protein